MGRPPREELNRIRDIKDSLATLHDGGPAGLEEVMPEVARLLEASRAAAYGLEAHPDKCELSFCHPVQFTPDAPRIFGEWVRGQRTRWALFDPHCPEPYNRNVALTDKDLVRWAGRLEATPLAKELFPRLGLKAHAQLRVLVCDGSNLLAFVGGWREEPFDSRTRERLQALVPALKRRLLLERTLLRARWLTSALAVTLEHVAAAAFVVDGKGRVLHANTAGRALLEKDRAGTSAALHSPGRARSGAFSFTRLAGPGQPDTYLAVSRAPVAGVEPRLSQLTAQWELTPRQREVLALLAAGRPNRSIAEELHCAEGTVELHVSALLSRACCESRAELIAKFWMER